MNFDTEAPIGGFSDAERFFLCHFLAYRLCYVISHVIHVSMYLKQIPSKNGRVFLTMAESRREGKKTKAVTVEALGYLDQLEKIHEDPISFYKEEAKRRTAEKKKEQELDGELMSGYFRFASKYNRGIDGNALESINLIKSLGWLPLVAVFNQLELGYFIDNRRKCTDAEYNHSQIWKLLVLGRILAPGSKLSTWRWREEVPEKMDFSDDDVYRSLPFFARLKDDMVKHINKRLQSIGCRKDDGLLLYDVTNYYWEIDGADEDEMLESGEIIAGMRVRGCSKEHRPEPIVQMGLMMDCHGMPFSYSLFPGNNNDVTTFMPMVENAIKEHGQKKTIYVADKGMMSGDNIASLILGHNGFIISRSVRSCGSELEEFVLDGKGYSGPRDGSFRIKERTVPTAINVTDINGNKHKVTVNLRQIAFFSRKYRDRMRKERAEAIEKAMKKARANKKDGALNTHGCNKYIKKTVFDGENEVERPSFSFALDEELKAREEALDGYYLIFSNVYGQDDEHRQKEVTFNRRENSLLLPRRVSCTDILDMYRNLWRVEDCFRLTKSFLRARPAYVRDRESIEAHFLSCYVALVILKALEKKTEGRIEVSRMTEELRKANLFLDEDGWMKNTYSSNVLKAVGEATGIDMTRKKYRKADLRKIIGSTRKRP